MTGGDPVVLALGISPDDLRAALFALISTAVCALYLVVAFFPSKEP